MSVSLVITLPRHDDTTEYISQWSYEINEEAQRKNLGIKELKDENANRAEFEKAVRRLNPRIVVLNGHGSDKAVCGYKDEPLVICGVNDKILFGRIIYARSCNAATKLGVECTKDSDLGCFIGYGLPFMFYIDPKWSTNPRKDNTARIFLEPSNIAPISLIKGNSAAVAHENSRRQILKNIKKVLREKSKDAYLFAEALWNNYEGQVLLGNTEAVL